jgi:dTDP-4-amino-4,6-dideoxygalactose transaminase
MSTVTRQGSGTLSILGGAPAFEEPLCVGRPNLCSREGLFARISQILENRWLTNHGPFVRSFEEQIAQCAGVKHCVATCNGTIALQIAIRALGLEGEVIVPSLTFVATAHALEWQGITPVFADIDPATHNLNPACVAGLITAKTTGIIGVHLWGRPCDTDALEAIGRRHGLKVMYDAAHAFSCTRRGRTIGGFGACEVFSFHATKFVNSCEGGAVATNNDELAEKMRLMRNFGFAGYDHVIHPGINGKMNELCAAMGITSLEAKERILATNRRNYGHYRQQLRGLDGISLIRYDPRERNNYQYIVLEVDSAAAGLTRDELVQVLHAENVLARKYFWPGCHRLEPYRSSRSAVPARLAATEYVAARLLVLPTGTTVSLNQIERICDIIRAALAQAPDVRCALSGSQSAQPN